MCYSSREMCRDGEVHKIKKQPWTMHERITAWKPVLIVSERTPASSACRFSFYYNKKAQGLSLQ